MDYDKRIEELNNWNEYTISELCGMGKMPCKTHCDNERCIVSRAASALETSWHENQALRGLINGLDAELSHVRSGLARVTAERDAALTDLNTLRLGSGWQCYACDNADALEGDSRCNGCNYREGNNYKWRGIKEED